MARPTTTAHEWHPLRRRLLWLWIRFWLLRIAHFFHLYRPYPYRPCKPAERGGGTSVGIGTVDDSQAFLQREHDNGSTEWSNMCESLSRQSYQLAAMYSSAESHGRAVPSSFQHAHEQPARGDIVLYLNGGYGHIATCTGNGWDAWTNDYTGKGRVGIADARDMAPWCGADRWFIADAWWASDHYRMTHDGSGDTPEPPATDLPWEEESMIIVSPTGANYLLHGGHLCSFDGATGNNADAGGVPRFAVTQASWDNLVRTYPVVPKPAADADAL